MSDGRPVSGSTVQGQSSFIEQVLSVLLGSKGHKRPGGLPSIRVNKLWAGCFHVQELCVQLVKNRVLGHQNACYRL